MNKDLRTVFVPGGKFIYYVNEDRDAVLVDYIGSRRILIIPDSLPCDENPDTDIPVAAEIPDEAFESCTSVEYIVDMNGSRFGSFTFTHCPKLTGVISVDTDDTEISEFSFADKRNIPKSIRHDTLISDDDDGWNSPARQLVRQCLYQCAAEDNLEKLLQLSALGHIGRALRIAIEYQDIGRLHCMDALGLLGEHCPFTYSIGTAVKYKCDEVFRFLVQRHMYNVYDSEGSALFVTVQQNRPEYAAMLLAEGYNPFSMTPEWDGTRPILDYALENNRTEITGILLEYQHRQQP